MKHVRYIPTGRATVLLEETIVRQRYRQQVSHGRALRDAGEVCPTHPESVMHGWIERNEELRHEETRAALRGDVDPEAETVRIERGAA